jgi:cysteinyl-tRNA synthetase
MLKVYNTLSRKKEIFKPRKNKKINLFVCGITPYDFAHIGHARTYVVFNMIVRYLRAKGYDVFYLQNITDVDDKIINRAKEEKIFWKNLSRKFEKEYLKDMKTLNIDSVNKYARATDYIKEIISQVKRLLKKGGVAYQLKDGIYYEISKFQDYGKLAGRTILQTEDSVSRIDEDKKKKNKGDFCLWKFFKPKEPKWKSPFGWGRPGWHIEDTAITEKFFGSQYDIHGGARDLIFPHHEAEIAQIETISGKKPMVKYWLHTGFLTVKGQKMSKSLKNFITIKDFLAKNSPRILKLLIIKSHYRSPLDYNENLIIQIKKELEKIDEFINKLKLQITNYKLQTNSKFQISKFQKQFEVAMDDDFNTPKAMAVLFDLINKGNSLIAKNLLSKTDAKSILGFLKKIDKIFGFIFWKKDKEKIPSPVLELAKKRKESRKKRDWQRSDYLREEIKKLGYSVEDTKKGFKIKEIINN